MSSALVRLTSEQLTVWLFRVLAWASVAWILGTAPCLMLFVVAVLTQVAARIIFRVRENPAAARTALSVAVAAHVLVLLATFRAVQWPFAVPAGMTLFFCLSVSYLVDVRRGAADPRSDLAALLYLVQLPVFPAGPISRFQEFRTQLAHGEVTMASFSYGIRRIVTGLIKVLLIADPLHDVTTQIFALRVTRLSTDSAWLGAIAASLETYFWVSGFSEIGIGLGRIVGFRLQENFRRPFTADSLREFWRRWNVTLMTWLRDYLGLPIADHDRHTVRVFLSSVAGMFLVGAWQTPSLHAVPFAVFFASVLAAESLGLGKVVHRWPRALRHVYVLLVVTAGWLLLRASGPGPLLGYVEAMLGLSIAKFGASAAYFTWGFTTVFICALIFAGPMVGNISRWRVSVDAAVASLIMMLAATGVLMWQAVVMVRRVTSPRNDTRKS